MSGLPGPGYAEQLEARVTPCPIYLVNDDVERNGDGKD